MKFESLCNVTSIFLFSFFSVRFFLSVLSEDDVLISAHASTAYVMRYRAGCVPIWSGFEFYFRVWSGAGGGRWELVKRALINRRFRIGFVCRFSLFCFSSSPSILLGNLIRNRPRFPRNVTNSVDTRTRTSGV